MKTWLFFKLFAAKFLYLLFFALYPAVIVVGTIWTFWATRNSGPFTWSVSFLGRLIIWTGGLYGLVSFGFAYMAWRTPNHSEVLGFVFLTIISYFGGLALAYSVLPKGIIK